MNSGRTVALPLARASASFHVTASSDVGSVRAVNEDSFVASWPVFAVADGMGGHAFGDRASQTVAAVLGDATSGEGPTNSSIIMEAIREANRQVRTFGDADATSEVIAGSTLAGVAFLDAGEDGTYYWMAFNVGDSRVYSWDGRVMAQITVDHSAVQEMVDAGSITSDQAAVHPQRNVITRAIGVEVEVDADIWLIPAGGRQVFLICSDGLTKELDDEAIALVLASHHGAEVGGSVADALVQAALAAGGADNVTVVVVESDITADGVAISSGPTGTAFLEETVPRTEG